MKNVVRAAAIILLISASGPAFADIGENFAAAGIQIYGDGYVRIEAGQIFSDANEIYSTTVSLRPGIALLLVDNLAVSVSPRFYYTNYHYSVTS